jgi:hypothetical protein
MSLQVHFHFADGSQRRFAQNDLAKAQSIFDYLQRGKIFTQPSLVISSEQSVTAIPPSTIARLDVIMDEADLPDWLLNFDNHAPQVQKWEVAPEQFSGFVQLQQNDLLSGTDEPHIVFEEIRLAGGACCFIEVHLPPQASANASEGTLGQRRHLHTAFTMPHYACRRVGGGMCILNPAQIISYTFYPRLEPPANAWLAEPIS